MTATFHRARLAATTLLMAGLTWAGLPQPAHAAGPAVASRSR